MPDTKKIICMAVDDEPPALDVIRSHIAAMPVLELAGTCCNAIEALQMLLQKQVDLLFIDINLPQVLGTDLVKALKHPPKIIFTTAYRQYAVEGFELDAIDYLLKPISFERFERAVNKLIAIPETREQNIQSAEDQTSPSFIYFRADRKILKVLLEDILYIESLKDYIKVVTKTKTIITRQSITSIQNALPKNLFIRIHRSFIVAFKSIDAYKPESIEIAKYELPVSRLYRHEVESRLQQ
jgi:DNA-binding LytR/AlgR family response regulator